MDKDYFSLLEGQFRSPHLWYYKDSEWKLRHSIIQNH